MYDFDRDAVEAWWQAIAAGLRDAGIADVPRVPAWPADLDAHWRDPELLLSQTCGYPAANALRDVMQVVGAFRYTAPGCSGVRYRSELMVRQDDPGRRIDDFRGRVAAFNDLQSHSGFHGLRARVAGLSDGGPFFGRHVESGSHRASLALLQAGRADIAAIDCITLAGLARTAPALVAGLHSIGHTEPAPGLPLVTARRTSAANVAHLRRVLHAAVADPRLAGLRERLFIEGFEETPASAWAGMAAESSGHAPRRTAPAHHVALPPTGTTHD